MRISLIILLAFASIAATGSAHAGLDTLSQARMAAIEGDHASCAELADKARREANAIWHAHHVYATCQIYATEARRATISKAEYAEGINKAIDALQFLANTPGLLATEEQRASVQFVVEELTKRIDQ